MNASRCVRFQIFTFMLPHTALATPGLCLPSGMRNVFRRQECAIRAAGFRQRRPSTAPEKRADNRPVLLHGDRTNGLSRIRGKPVPKHVPSSGFAHETDVAGEPRPTAGAPT